MTRAFVFLLSRLYSVGSTEMLRILEDDFRGIQVFLSTLY